MIKSIPLNKLVQSPRNVRRHSDPAADAELKASVAAHGLLQNLIVRPFKSGGHGLTGPTEGIQQQHHTGSLTDSDLAAQCLVYRIAQ